MGNKTNLAILALAAILSSTLSLQLLAYAEEWWWCASDEYEDCVDCCIAEGTSLTQACMSDPESYGCDGAPSPPLCCIDLGHNEKEYCVGLWCNSRSSKDTAKTK
jgi:hypothetical protein